jgi:hypothetical protein
MKRVEAQWHLYPEAVAVYVVMHQYRIHLNFLNYQNVFKHAWKMVIILANND